MQPHTPRLILASGSAYRRQLLERLQIPFITRSPDIDEAPLPGESALHTALRLARQKAEAVAAHDDNVIVIGSDQVALLDQQQIGKPGNHQNALNQLRRMQGRTVVFHTALCVLDRRYAGSATPSQFCSVDSAVTFRTLPDAQLDRYLRIEQPYDCAGSAKNEGLGIALISAITSSDPTALTGLPLIALTSMLMQLGMEFFAEISVGVR